MSTLTGPHRPPHAGGSPDSLVVMLHGIGADGGDLIGLGGVFAGDFPNTAFHAPNAPDPYAEGEFGYQWFPRGALPENGHAEHVEQLVNAYVDELLAHYGLDASRCLLLGFSQGAIVALHVAPRREEPALAGVISFSGAMYTAGTLRSGMKSTPPVVLVHGAEDGVLPARETEVAARKLDGAGIPASVHILPALGHTIDERGVNLAKQFMKRVLRGS